MQAARRAAAARDHRQALTLMASPASQLVAGRWLMGLDDCHSIDDFRELARRRLPGPIFHYIDGAADDEITRRRNTAAFDDCDLVPDVLAGAVGLLRAEIEGNSSPSGGGGEGRSRSSRVQRVSLQVVTGWKLPRVLSSFITSRASVASLPLTHHCNPSEGVSVLRLV